MKLLATGLSSLFWSGGEMQLLVGNPKSLSDDDWDAIVSSEDKVYQEISKLFPSIEELKKLMEDDNVRAFAELLKSGRLEMRFVLARRVDQLFHAKFGIIVDSQGDGVAFAGSTNETIHGLEGNIEVFNTFKSWNRGELDFYNDYASIFADYWEGRHIDGIVVSSLPDGLKRDVVNASNEYSREHAIKNPGHIYLRQYQLQAMDYWKRSGYIGMLEMATGTGKTLTALACVKELFEREGKHPVVIAVPTGEVAKQWSSSWMAFFGQYPKVYTSVGGDKDKLREYASIFGEGAVIIATYNFLSAEYFSLKVQPFIGNHAVLIADEAHHLGAPQFRNVLSDSYQFRLGLSATPHRLFDDEGNDAIESFFGKDVFSFSLKQAIEGGYLSEYNYFPRFVELTDEEAEEYSQLTSKISKSFARHPQTHNEDRNTSKGDWKKLIYARARIVKKASAKYNEMNGILSDLKNNGGLSKLMVFCEDKDQLGKVASLVASFGAMYGIISGETPGAERSKIIRSFTSGDIAVIIAMKVMDEGIDIGSAERAILMSSAKDPRQYIQRAGRVLRKSPGKPIAEIFDIIVYADPIKVGKQMEVIEKGAIRGEIRRTLYFTETARNQLYCLDMLDSLKQKIDISLLI